MKKILTVLTVCYSHVIYRISFLVPKEKNLVVCVGWHTTKERELFADNAKYYWNGGDSLIGKPAIDKYWRDRRINVIDSVSFQNDIWLPIKVNTPQQKERTGVWLMGWYQVTAKYKGGSSMTQWMHILYHFDENDKIDEVNHFVDRLPIMAAMKPKK